MSRSLADLHPEFRLRVDGWLENMASASLDYLITCTLRSSAEQDALYAKGRSLPGKIVTYKKAGQSAHQYGLALDFVIMDHGKPDWSGEDEPWNLAINMAKARGLESLRPMESAHLQLPNWKLLAGVTV